jgi:SAM-dependent methyltransferase
MPDDDYLRVNHANWEARVPLHATSAGYGIDRFRADPEHLSDVVRFDLPRLGDVAGLDVLHLQCHIGTDTVSLARLGAQVTGLDFSASALAVARELFAECGAEGRFVESDVYAAVDALGPERFDLVYTGIGAISWLPDIEVWATVVAGLLRPGGHLFIRDGHPVLFSLDDERADDLLAVEYPYFESAGVRWDTDVSYVEHEGRLEHTTTIEFNHGLAQIITAVLDAGMDLVAIEEHDTVPWNALGHLMEEVPGGEFRLRDRPDRVPMSFTLQARKAI